MKDKEVMYIPVVTPEFETFDTISFEKFQKENERFSKEIRTDGTVIVMDKLKVGLFYGEVSPKSHFVVVKNFHLNGNIKAKGLGFNYDSFTKGIWYYYDEQGNLTETIDYDKPFKFTLEKVLEFCEKEGIIFKTGYIEWNGEYHPSIRREYKPELGICYWEIEWLSPNIGKIETIRLDGVTGKEISRDYMDYIR